MMARNGLIFYDGLPISSSGAHSLGRLPMVAAWKAFQRFLSACTTANEPKRVSVAINELPETDPAFLQYLRESAELTLGMTSPPNRHDDYRENGSSSSWDLAPSMADAAVKWIAEAEPLPANWLGGPASVTLDYQFRLKSPDGIELPFQRSEDYLGQIYDGYGVVLGESGCRLRLAAKASLSLILFLPFEAPGSDFVEYVRFVQKNLPITLSKKHWKHWRLTKKGNAYSDRHIEAPDL